MIAVNTWEKTVIPILPPVIAAAILTLSPSVAEQITEIRMRVGQPVLIMMGRVDRMLCSDGALTGKAAQVVYCTREDIIKALQLISRNSLYAFEQELRSGYITITGGHRVGIAGQAVIDNGKLKTLKNISSLNIRLSREQKGAADMIFPYVVTNGRIASTLIISPPRCGKTTLLRDLIRQISSGNLHHGFTGAQVGVVDERSELAGCCDGVPTVDLGPRVDVLDGCLKATGMIMLIRSMAPQAIATDELGSADDVRSVREALYAGVAVLTTIHGHNAQEVACRPYVGDLLTGRCFERLVILSDQPMIGTIEEINDARSGCCLYHRKNGVKVCG